MGNYFQDFLRFLRDHGFDPIDKIIADDSPHRLKQRGDKGGKTTAMYILKIDERGAVGRVTDFKRNEQFTFSHKNPSKYTPEQAAIIKARIEAERKNRHERITQDRINAALMARNLWEKGKKSGEHSYLQKKKIPLVAAKILRDELLVPIHNAENRLVNLQRIREDSERPKLFLKGGEIKGCYCPILTKDRHCIYIAEGFASGVSAHLALNATVLCAMQASNLHSVARTAREKYPASGIIILADNDEHLLTKPPFYNVGVRAGIHAAQACNGKCIWPRTDNDYSEIWVKHGAMAVKNAIMAELPESKIA